MLFHLPDFFHDRLGGFIGQCQGFLADRGRTGHHFLLERIRAGIDFGQYCHQALQAEERAGIFRMDGIRTGAMNE